MAADPEYVASLLAALGGRYRFAADGATLERRYAKEAFRATGVKVGDAGRIEVEVTVRCRDAGSRDEADRLLAALDARTMAPRGFARAEGETIAMRSAGGREAGEMIVVHYAGIEADSQKATHVVRAFVEGVERTLVAGVHGEADVTATEPPPAAPGSGERPHRGEIEFTIERRLLRARYVVADLDAGTLTTYVRRGISTRQDGESIRAQRVAGVTLRSDARGCVAVARTKEGAEVPLGVAARKEDLDERARKLAAAFRCPFAET